MPQFADMEHEQAGELGPVWRPGPQVSALTRRVACRRLELAVLGPEHVLVAEGRAQPLSQPARHIHGHRIAQQRPAQRLRATRRPAAWQTGAVNCLNTVE